MKIIKLGFILLIVTSLAAASLALVYKKTSVEIEKATKEKIFKLQKEIMPLAASFEKENEYTTLALDEEGNAIGKIILSKPKGYAGAIEMLVGIDFKNKITKMKIVKQSETPGLGAKITKPEFLAQFENKTKDQLKLKKDSSSGTIDAITGATISSRAIIKGIKDAVELSNTESYKTDTPDRYETLRIEDEKGGRSEK